MVTFDRFFLAVSACAVGFTGTTLILALPSVTTSLFLNLLGLFLVSWAVSLVLALAIVLPAVLLAPRFFDSPKTACLSLLVAVGFFIVPVALGGAALSIEVLLPAAIGGTVGGFVLRTRSSKTLHQSHTAPHDRHPG